MVIPNNLFNYFFIFLGPLGADVIVADGFFWGDFLVVGVRERPN